ncbi:MAG: sulfate adenylyltransferase [Gemmatimonadota bacterium]|nr:sulfate adenylyltransferase [Gemmatimonadota bacterium]
MSLPAYGGTLVDRTTTGGRTAELRSEAAGLPTVQLGESTLSDLYLIAVGALSPLDGFMDQTTWRSVVSDLQLPSGLPWGVPIVLPCTADEAASVSDGVRAALIAPNGDLAGIIDVTGRFDRDVAAEAAGVYGTEDLEHPGVAAIHRTGPICLSGRIEYCYAADISGFPEANLTPAQTRAAFAERGWETIVAFQTRNPIHRAHEYLQKCALEMVDGLLIHPLVGETKSDDIPADVRMECYEVLLDKYFVKDRVMLSVLPAAMRYAGPREAIHHSIMRRNYGCTHFIVGRDHAGVGSYYGTYDAQKIFDEIDGAALGIVPLKFEHAFYCKLTGQMSSAKTSPSGPEDRVFLSGTKVREMLTRGERPPGEFTRPEVADVLMKAYRN